ncbi:MAG: carbohydrate-binding family 9-like protein [Pigmentiphaga sp.]|nr:carbohydrate-binding family 9-like protein [Pigmentiphaga sp.]
MDTIFSILSKQKNFEMIDQVNWPDTFPLKPACKFIIARSDKALYIHYVVNEKQIQALYSNDQDPVWQDSCVEFFCRLPDSKTYFNFEFNCIGTCLATERISRTEGVNPLSADKMSQIKRYPSSGNQPFQEKKGNFDWTLTVAIPFKILNINSNNLPARLRANFYKCGDGTSAPHYVSWNPILVENPDFHQPEYFGELAL